MHLIAPHPDDELLGAFWLLTLFQPHVIVCGEDRTRASKALGERLGYDVSVWPWPNTPELWVRIAERFQALTRQVWLPSPIDAHHQHQRFSSLANLKPGKVGFYSVLPIGVLLKQSIVLSRRMWERKKALFQEFFPCEAEKYMHLLEEVGPREYFLSPGKPFRWRRTESPLPVFGEEGFIEWV